MIEEVIKEIKDAEAQADELMEKAYDDGKKIVLDAEIKSEAQKKATVSECREDMKKALAEAQKKADIERSGILVEGEKQAEAFKNDKKKLVETVADDVVSALLKKYGV